jgi:hypothetical protein
VAHDLFASLRGPAAPPRLIASGRYLIDHAGRECGEERWSIEEGEAGPVATGEQVLESPHPFPSRQEWRVRLTRAWRLSGLEIAWTVGTRRLRAVHGADGERWHARIEYGGEVREQQGDYPAGCEVEFASPLHHVFILARRDFALEGEHEFPVLRIGPPWMAVSPERMRIRCVELGRRDTPWGAAAAKRYVESLLRPAPGGGYREDDQGYTFWADERGFVLESHEGRTPTSPWMRLIEYRGRPWGGPAGGGASWAS